MFLKCGLLQTDVFSDSKWETSRIFHLRIENPDFHHEICPASSGILKYNIFPTCAGGGLSWLIIESYNAQSWQWNTKDSCKNQYHLAKWTYGKSYSFAVRKTRIGLISIFFAAWMSAVLCRLTFWPRLAFASVFPQETLVNKQWTWILIHLYTISGGLWN